MKPLSLLALSLAIVGCAVTSPSDSIGSAMMDDERIVILQLRAEGGSGATGDARLYYEPTHPEYQEILDHVGGLRPGESKPVPPWPAENNAATSDNMYAIFPASYPFSEQGFSSRWDPTDADVEQGEQIMRECQPQGVENVSLDSFVKQYVGIVNSEGEKELWVAAFHKKLASQFSDWQEELVIVDDGGSDFFEIVVNIETRSCHDLYIHGEA